MKRSSECPKHILNREPPSGPAGAGGVGGWRAGRRVHLLQQGAGTRGLRGQEEVQIVPAGFQGAMLAGLRAGGECAETEQREVGGPRERCLSLPYFADSMLFAFCKLIHVSAILLQ